MEQESSTTADAPQNKKVAIFSAALALIAEQGFTGAPMSQIAERADVGVGTIYRYFANKEDLVNALYLHIKARLAAYVLHGYTDDMPIDAAFRLLLRNMVQFLSSNPSEMSFMEQYENSPIITEATQRDISGITEPGHELFKRASAQGLLRDLPFDVLLSMVRGALIALVKLKRSSAGSLDDDTMDAALAAIWDIARR